MRFAFVKEWRHIWQVETICRVMQVTARGFRKWLTRPMSRRQRSDMKVLAHIREQYGLSLGSAVYPERPPCGQSKGTASYDDGA
jgi:putative transposase